MILEFTHHPGSDTDSEEYIATLPHCRIEFVAYFHSVGKGSKHKAIWRVRVDRHTPEGARTVFVSRINYYTPEGAQKRLQDVYDAQAAIWTLLDETAPPRKNDEDQWRIHEFKQNRARRRVNVKGRVE